MLDKSRSLYLELLRIIAAFYVFIYHFGSEPIEGKPFLASSTFNQSYHINWYSAHFFVIVFFVLSGYLITMSAHKKGTTFTSYVIARLGRIYSVVIPALVFSYFVAFVLRSQHHQLINDDKLVSRFFLNLLFLTQSWNFCAMPPVNGPFWSISYEVMYYLIFGAFLLIAKPYKYFIAILFVLLAGPKVLLLFPAWITGSWLYSITSKEKRIINERFCTIIFLFSLFVIIYFIINPYQFPLLKLADTLPFHYNLFFSWNYQADYLFSVLIFINLFGFFGFSHKLNDYLNKTFYDKIIKVVFLIGNSTFTLYLFHVPLMIFLASIFPYNKLNIWHNLLLISVTLVSIYFIARVTEWKVKYWREFISRFFKMLLDNRFIKNVKSSLS